MNYFAHLVLSQPTIESTVGNLLGDFARGIDRAGLNTAVLAGLENHRAVDRYTDQDDRITGLKKCFKPNRRRFAGIALDVYFDHLLLNHWNKFDERDTSDVIAEFYRRMERGQDLMPSREMRRVTSLMISYDWFSSYRDIDSVARALDRIAMRIRFPNNFANAIEDLQQHENEILTVFLDFFPELINHVEWLAYETGRVV